MRGRTVLLLDDILDEGHTLAAIKEKCLSQGAARVVIADVYGWWRNLPAIHALTEIS